MSGEEMAAVIDPPINPVRKDLPNSLEAVIPVGSALPSHQSEGKLDWPIPPCRLPYWALNHTGGCSSPELDQVDQHSSPGRVKIN